MKTFRVVVLGGDKVGKTSLVHGFMEGCQGCIDNEIYSKTVSFPDGLFHRVDVLDTINLDDFPSMREVYIRQGDMFIVVYAVDDERSFERVKGFCDEIRKYKGQDFGCIAVVGNKIDRLSSRKISTERACVAVQEQQSCLFTETSAILNLNTQCPFKILFKVYKQTEEENHFKLKKSSKRAESLYICGRKKESTSYRLRSFTL